MRTLGALILAVLLTAGAGAQSYSGRFVGRTEEGATIEAVLKQDSANRVTGSLTQDGISTPFSGKVSGGRLSATVRVDDETIPFGGVLNGSVLKLTVMGSTVSLTRAGTASVPTSPRSPKTSKLTSSSNPNVKINGVRLDPALIRKLDQKYHLRFVSGDYWYDRRCGAWGVTGRGASGVVRPGIDMGGKLRRDASGGDTGVFINGRELNFVEVALLRQLGPVPPGRYWIDSRWNYGREGERAIGNIVADAQARQAPRQGILSTWDKTGVAVFDLR